MSTLKEHEEIVERLRKNVSQLPGKEPTFEYLQAYFSEAQFITQQIRKTEWTSKIIPFNLTEYVKVWCQQLYLKTKEQKYWEMYWNVLLWESPYLFDSFMLYIEKEREPKMKFYAPRRKVLRKLGLIQALQDMEDDKYDILTISMPPGTGKALRNSELVLTPDGFVRMGSLREGDTVIGGSLKPCKILGVYPQGKRVTYRLTLENGSYCDCSVDHLWNVFDCISQKVITVCTRDIIQNINQYKIPKTDENLKEINYFNVVSCNRAGNDDCTCIYVDDETHLFITRDYIITHNTTLEKFFIAWVIGRHPEMFSLFYSHSRDITQMFYEGVLDITTSNEYLYSSVFPIKLTKTNAKSQQINFEEYKPFPNLQTGTIDSRLAGKVRCNAYLLCDDLIGSMSEAMNRPYLEKLWMEKYATDAKQRKMTGCKEIHIATRWSVHDVIGKIMAIEANNKKAKFIACDCYDSNRKSQFEYAQGVGLSTFFLNEQERFMDDVTFGCLYRNRPVEREGLLYFPDDIRTYDELPGGNPDRILGICDTKSKGSDYFVLAVFYQYDKDYYLVDCICSSDSNYNRQYERAAKILLKHNVQLCQFESNSGGDRVALEVSKMVKDRHGKCVITDKFTTQNKETKIIVEAAWVKMNVVFKSEKLYTRKEDYGVFMSQLLTYSTSGKNPHDDVPDALAAFSQMVETKFRVKRAMVSGSMF